MTVIATATMTMTAMAAAHMAGAQTGMARTRTEARTVEPTEARMGALGQVEAQPEP